MFNFNASIKNDIDDFELLPNEKVISEDENNLKIEDTSYEVSSIEIRFIFVNILLM